MSDQIQGWVGIDLDGTLAFYDGWKGANHIGEPVPLMLQRVKKLISDGVWIKIFTARASDLTQIQPVKDWCKKHGLGDLQVTNVKDYAMIELWDDRAIQVIKNTGKFLSEEFI